LEYVLHFTILILVLLSLALMLISIRKNSPFNWMTVIGVLTSLGMFSIEYFVGLELARPFIIWFSLKQPAGKKKIVETLKYWLPYGVVLAVFFYWRIFIYSFTTYQPVLISGLKKNPLKVFIDLGWRMLQDMITVVLRVWAQAFDVVDSYPVIFLQAAIILGGGLLAWFVVSRLSKHIKTENSQPAQPEWGLQAIMAGLLLMFLAGVPFWVTGINLWLSFPWDRTTLPFIPGACLLIVGTVELVLQPRYRNVFLAGLIGLSFGIHYLNVQTFINEWDEARSILWQLTWRAPMIKAGTSLVTDVMPVVYYGDNTLSPAINWTYAPDVHQEEIPYRLFDLNIRQDSPVFSNPGRNMPIEHHYRNFLFDGNTNQMLTVIFKRNACVRVYGAGDRVAPGTSDRIKDTLYLSDLNLIDAKPARAARPPFVVGAEPQHGWCYYFEKADLARQQQDWKTVSDLANQTLLLNLSAQEPSENLIFIEGLLHTGEWNLAQQLSAKTESDAAVKLQTCDLWSSANPSGFEPAGQAAWQQVSTTLACH
ncbi:MAG: hypothetical protein LWX83_10340, partial [Anaerolineae bacterium]|nr:hypothetical protein [Anaerolineae bacterium]